MKIDKKDSKGAMWILCLFYGLIFILMPSVEEISSTISHNWLFYTIRGLFIVLAISGLFTVWRKGKKNLVKNELANAIAFSILLTIMAFKWQSFVFSIAKADGASLERVKTCNVREYHLVNIEELGSKQHYKKATYSYGNNSDLKYEYYFNNEAITQNKKEELCR